MVGRVTLAKCSVELDDDGILVVVHDEGSDLDAAEIDAILGHHRALADGHKLPVLIDARGVRRMDREARERGSGPEVAAVTSRLAIVVGSAVSAVIGNFFMRVSRPHYPTRLFTDVAEAHAWLLGGDGA